MLLRLACPLLVLSTLTFACRGDDPGGSSESSTGASTGSTGDNSTSTTAEPTTTAAASSSTSGEPTTDPCGQGFIGNCTSSSSTGSAGPQPLGGPCMTDDECESLNCYQNPLMPGQGVCSECNEDADCLDAMTGISCSFGVSGWATCEDGSLGDRCMSQAACMDGLFCDGVINIPIPGIIPDVCNECASSSDCMDPQICSPVIDFMEFSGSKVCVDPGSVPNDSLCPSDDPMGDAACMSGHCTEATIMAIVTLGICGECETDADCMGGTCVPAEASMNGIKGSVCM